jgi:hypothetical protein
MILKDFPRPMIPLAPLEASFFLRVSARSARLEVALLPLEGELPETACP